MSDNAVSAHRLIEWGVAARMLPGQLVSGDSYVVKSLSNGALVAAVDGLGHGEEAAAAAQIAVATLRSRAPAPLAWLVERCHEAMGRTRGAAMTIASIDEPTGAMTWLGVGNVNAALVRADEAARPLCEWILPRAGVVGFRLPPLRESLLPIKHGDTLILATDGICDGFAHGLTPGNPPQQTADGILARDGKDTDDALVLVARYVGGAP